jgi:hypothetical protein
MIDSPKIHSACTRGCSFENERHHGPSCHFILIFTRAFPSPAIFHAADRNLAPGHSSDSSTRRDDAAASTWVLAAASPGVSWGRGLTSRIAATTHWSGAVVLKAATSHRRISSYSRGSHIFSCTKYQMLAGRNMDGCQEYSCAKCSHG